MKKIHIALLIGGILCAASLVLGGAALALTGFDFYRTVSTMTYQQKTAAYEPSLLDSIDIAAEDLKVTVSPSADGQVHLSYWESAVDTVSLDVENGVLRFRHSAQETWLDNFVRGFWSSFSRYRHVIEIQIPADWAGNLAVTNQNAAVEASNFTALSSALFRSQNGAVTLADIVCHGSLEAGTTNADLSLDRVTAGSTRITDTNARIRLTDAHLGDTVLETDNGALLLHTVEVGSLTAKTKNAAVEAEALTGTGRLVLETTNATLTAIDVMTDGELSLQSKNGGLRATNCHSAALLADTTNGKIILTRCRAGRVQAGTSNAAVEFERLDSGDIALTSSNGGIKGSVLGREEDYIITASTTNGSCNLTNRVGDLPGHLYLQTTNASIHITFTE